MVLVFMEGMTLLHTACSVANETMIIFLKRNGVDINAKCDDDGTAFSCLDSKGKHYVCVLWLENLQDCLLKIV